MNNKYIFNTANSHLEADKSLQNIKVSISQLEVINSKIRKYMPHLAEIAHCGAINYITNTVVIFVKTNAAMYQVNNFISSIEDILKSNGFFFDKFLVKVNPNHTKVVKSKHRTKSLTKEQVASLEKIAFAIGRPELVNVSKAHTNKICDEDGEIKIDL